MDFRQGQPALTILEWVLRAVVTFWWLLLVTKLMGQREIGRLTLFDFIIAITIGSVAAAPLANNTVTLIGSLITIAALGSVNILTSYFALKNPYFRRVVQDEPLVIIQNGQILEDTMRKARLNLDDLLTELRLKQYPNIHDVEFAFLESNGRISVIPKFQFRPVGPSDLKVGTVYEGMPTVLVEDGNIVEDNLRENKLDQEWLMNQMKQKGVKKLSDVMTVILDTKGRVYISIKNQTNDELVH